jgi:hypothetical protein
MDPFMIKYAHSHGMRVLMAGEGTGANLTDPVSRAKAINGSIAAMRSMNLDGVGWDLEVANVDDPHYQQMVALFMAEYRAAWPESFHAFYIGNLQHRNAWEAPAMRRIAASVDLVIVSAYTETNDTAPAGVGRTACDRPCGSTSLPSVQSALHDPVDGWARVVGKEKLVLALGWFHLQTMTNKTKASDPTIPAQLGVRISFCQAVSLAKSRGFQNRRFDNESSSKCVCRHRAAWAAHKPGNALLYDCVRHTLTNNRDTRWPISCCYFAAWVFDCEHDAANESTFRGCGPWPDAAEPVTTEVWYDDAVSSDAKLAAIKAAEWRGVAFWQASGMWPGGNIMGRRFDNASNVAVFCKAEIAALWQTVQRYW